MITATTDPPSSHISASLSLTISTPHTQNNASIPISISHHKLTHSPQTKIRIGSSNRARITALSSFAAAEITPNWDDHYSRITQFSNGKPTRKSTQINRAAAEEEDDGDDDDLLRVGIAGETRRMVKCEVEVISWRERRVKAQVSVKAHVHSVWNALTDYERLADFIPNLVSSGRIPCPHPGRIWLEQRGLQRALYWHIEARVVLDLQEVHNSENDRELHFFMVDGDFKKFEGKWSVKSRKGYVSSRTDPLDYGPDDKTEINH